MIEFYLSCLVDRDSSKIAFISSAEGGVDIEEVARKKPEKIIILRVQIFDLNQSMICLIALFT